MPTAKRDRDGLYQRPGSQVWYVQRRNKRISLGTADKALARIKLRELERGEADPSYAAARESTLEAVTLDWLDAIAGRPKPPKPPTLEMYRTHVGHFARILGAELSMARIDARLLDRYFTERRTDAIGKLSPRRVSAETLVKERGTWRQMLLYAKRTRRWHLDPEVELPAMKSDYRPLTRALTEAELPRLMAELAPHRAAIAAFLASAGADWCAVWTAEAGDFTGPPAPAIGPRAHPSAVLVRGTKNPGRWRSVPVVHPFGALAAQARAWLEEHGAFERWLRPNQTRDFAAACARAGVPRVTARDLRRTHGRILRARGVPPSLIGDMLRHSDGGRTAARVYGQLEPVDLGRLVNAVTAPAAPATGTESVQPAPRGRKKAGGSRV